MALTDTRRVIVFDLDDTLYPEWSYAFSGFDAVAAAFGDELGGDRAPRMRELFHSPDRGRVFNVILEECRHADADGLLPRMIETFRTHKPKIELHPDADEALKRLRRSGLDVGSDKVAIGVITDGYAVTQHAKIDALGLRSRIDEIVVTDDWGRAYWKPHPRAFEEMARGLKVPHAVCTYVADNPAKDFVAPNALGWHTVWVRRVDGVHSGNDPPGNGAAQRTIATLSELWSSAPGE